MMKLLLFLAGSLLYMELVYHMGCFGFTLGNPCLLLPLVLTVASLETLVAGSVKRKRGRSFCFCFLGVEFLLYAAQLVYLSIFKQPLLWEIAVRGGGDALSNYWREALMGILQASPFLLLLALPMVLFGILTKRPKEKQTKGKSAKEKSVKWELPTFQGAGKLKLLLLTGAGVLLFGCVLLFGKYREADYYEEYEEFFDPLTVAQNMGALTMAQRDTVLSIEGLAAQLWDSVDNSQTTEPVPSEPLAEIIDPAPESPDEMQAEGEEAPETMPPRETSPAEEAPAPEEVLDTSPNQLPIDFAKLKAEASGSEEAWLAEYMEASVPVNRNEYTGIFEGYNLIFLTAEGFSPYAVREDLTPTLYRLVHSGFVFNNFYTPLWQTSTSDGEYINCTGLIPDSQFSMRNTGDNDMAFSLPRYFAKEGAGSMAYHNNSLSYYDRHITHNNLGYIFKAGTLGKLSEAEWGEYIFPMENPKAWPASDLEMMQGTVPEYVNQDRFNVYYMTVSGHMYYTFQGNRMSAKNKDAVRDLPMSENAQAYIACHIELDKALEYLLQELEAAGQLDRTVICLSADHYPYAMTQEQYEELAGRDLSENFELYRNNLILWNAGMEENPVIVDKVCGPMDIVPTLLNLFGFEYDSRLYAGKDILSGEEGMVIFNDRSFITDTVIYNRKQKSAVWQADLKASQEAAGQAGAGRVLAAEEEKSQYLEQMQQEVKNRYEFSAYILRNDYYHDIRMALPTQMQAIPENPALGWEKPAPPETQENTSGQPDASVQPDAAAPPDAGQGQTSAGT